MQENKLFIFLITFIFCTVSTNALPDIPTLSSIGKTPKIFSTNPPYITPGEIIKIKGENFFTYPKTANKVFLNNYPLRIITANKNEISVLIPRLPISNFKNSNLRFYTEYLNYKSTEISYPGNKYLEIKLATPEIISSNTYLVKPMEEIRFFGKFKKNYRLFFKLNTDIDISGEILSNNECKIILPKTLPKGPFKLTPYYKKDNIDLAPGESFILFNSESGFPLYLKINLEKNIFRQKGETSTYEVNLYLSSGEAVNITYLANISLSNENIFKLNTNEKTITAVDNGSSILEANFFFSPENKFYSYASNISTNFPQEAKFNEIIINEIFPFSTPFIKETDSSMDGIIIPYEDDFIELKNLTNKKINLEHCEIYVNDNDKPAYKLKESSIVLPESYFTIFGDEENKLNLNTTVSTVELKCNKKTIDYVAYPTGKNGDPSWQREDNSNTFTKHPVTLFSPNSPAPILLSPLKTPSPSTTPPIILTTNTVSTPIPTSSPTPIPTSNPLTIDSNEIKLTDISISPAELIFKNYTPIKLSVFANYSNGDKKDISDIATYKITGDEGIILNNKGLISPLKNGSVSIEITYSEKSIEKTIEVFCSVQIKSEVQAKELIINEVLAAPTFDTNNDGIFKSDQDEFIEIVNVSDKPLDISGLQIADGIKIRHTIQIGTILQPLEPIIIFGGGNNNLFTTSKSQIADTGSISINNTGQEQITITTQDGLIIDQVIFDNKNIQGISLNRTEDLTFSTLIQHDKVLNAQSKFSPGKKSNGELFLKL